MDALDRAVAPEWHPTWNAHETWAFLEGVFAAYGARGARYLVVFWDHGAWHTARGLRAKVAAHNAAAKRTGRGVRVLLFLLPKRSPWLMPLEGVSGQTKRAVGPRQRASLAELQAAVEARLSRRNSCAAERHRRYLLGRLSRITMEQH
jgi:hypothetical protein